MPGSPTASIPDWVRDLLGEDKPDACGPRHGAARVEAPRPVATSREAVPIMTFDTAAGQVTARLDGGKGREATLMIPPCQPRRRTRCACCGWPGTGSRFST